MKRPNETSTYTFDTSSKYPDHRSCDCVIRAISLATDIPWLDVYDGLCAIGRTLYRVPNEKVVYEKYMAKIGWIKKPMPKKENGNRYTVRELIKVLDGKTAMVAVANHNTCVKGGKVHDLWDCGAKSVCNYFVKP